MIELIQVDLVSATSAGMPPIVGLDDPFSASSMDESLEQALSGLPSLDEDAPLLSGMSSGEQEFGAIYTSEDDWDEFRTGQEGEHIVVTGYRLKTGGIAWNRDTGESAEPHPTSLRTAEAAAPNYPRKSRSIS